MEQSKGLLEGKSTPFTAENWKTVRTILSEYFGTALFVFIGLASCINWTHKADPDQLIRIGLAFGLGLSGIIYMFGPISGAHVNPAVTIAFMILGRTKILVGLAYIFAQLTGAITGAGILYVIQIEDFTGTKSAQFGLTQVNPELDIAQGLFIELTITTIFILVILFLTDECWRDYKHVAAIGIGFTLLVLELGFVKATGGSLNPARSLGPAVIVSNYGQLWIYFLGPIIGGILAVVLFKCLSYVPEKPAAPTPLLTATPSTNPITPADSIIDGSVSVSDSESVDVIVVDGSGPVTIHGNTTAPTPRPSAAPGTAQSRI